MNLLFVCQANILRSAAAEALARHLAGNRVSGSELANRAVSTNSREAAQTDPVWQFASAGTRALVGHAMHPDVAAALAKRGVPAEPHRSRQLTPQLVQAADLVLTFETEQRAWAIRQQPRAARKVLTLRRAARLLAADSPQPPVAPPAVAATPGSAVALDPAAALALLRADAKPYRDDDTFHDPIGQGSAAITAAVDEIAALLGSVIPYL